MKQHKLPHIMPDGSRVTRHPFVWCMDNRLEGRSKADLARFMGVSAQAVYNWEYEARRDRHFLLPALRAFQASKFFNVPVGLFHPGLEDQT